jgi:hypothetical protein
MLSAANTRITAVDPAETWAQTRVGRVAVTVDADPGVAVILTGGRASKRCPRTGPIRRVALVVGAIIAVEALSRGAEARAKAFAVDTPSLVAARSAVRLRRKLAGAARARIGGALIRVITLVCHARRIDFQRVPSYFAIVIHVELKLARCAWRNRQRCFATARSQSLKFLKHTADEESRNDSGAWLRRSSTNDNRIRAVRPYLVRVRL